MRAAIYARVSTEEQFEEGHSIDAQLRLTREFCERKGWTVVAEYTDPGWSGRTLKRPHMQELLTHARAKAFDVIVVHKLDRLSRSLVDTLTLLNDLNKVGVSFASATEDFDFTTPIGKVLLALLAAFAQYFIDNLREETKKGKRERAFKGLYNGTLPFGYRRVSREQGGVPVIDERNIAGYRMAMQMAVEGHSVREIVLAMNAAGYRTTGNWGERSFSEDTVLPMLKNRFYLGEVSYKGEWMRGKHEAAIDLDTWNRCQEQLHRRAAKRHSTKLSDRVYPLRKLLHCASCGRILRGHALRGERRYRDPSRDYGETCPEPASTRVVDLEEQMGAFFAKLRLPPDWSEKILKRVGEKNIGGESEERKRERLLGQLERAQRLYVLGDMKERDYLAFRSEIQEALAAIQPPQPPDLDRGAQMLANFNELWKRATDAERLRLMHAMVTKVLVKAGRIIAIEPRPAIYPLVVAALEHGRENGGSDGNSPGHPQVMPPAIPMPVAPAAATSHNVEVAVFFPQERWQFVRRNRLDRVLGKPLMDDHKVAGSQHQRTDAILEHPHAA